MSVVIIIGGGNVRNAVNSLESASLTMTEPQRSYAEKRLLEIADELAAMAAHPEKFA